MKLAAKTEYACLAMLELAIRYDLGEPVRVRTIADEHGIPARFLVQILLQLKGAGFVASTRGAAGGYQLIKRPEEISLGQVMAVIEGADGEINCDSADHSAAAQVLVDAWRLVAEAQREALYGITLENLVSRIKQQSENMFYI
jgi:Rrf2 family protein